MNKLDKNIKKWVQEVKFNVPEDIKNKFTEEIYQIEPVKSGKKARYHWFWPVFTTAASLLVVVVVLFFSFYFNKTTSKQYNKKLIAQSPGVEKEQSRKIIIRSVRIKNKPAKTFYFQSKNKNRLIVWTQKKEEK